MIPLFSIKNGSQYYNPYVFIFSAADEEAFEDNSEEYIRRDLEGSGNPQIYTKNTWSLNTALKS